MYRYLLIFIAVILGSSHASAQRQIHHTNPLCDDYVRLKTQEYLDGYETTNYDTYMAYKEEISRYCSEMISNNKLEPSSGESWDDYKNSGGRGAPSYNMSLD